ncbi:MAG: hypothetical protein R3B93_14385 [Bacteroidia bacterium]
MKITRDIVVFSDKEIFTKIWTSPRRVFQYLEENDYDKFVTSLLALAGIYQDLTGRFHAIWGMIWGSSLS